VPNSLCSLHKGFGCFQISAMGHCASAGGAIPDGTAKKNPHLFLGDGKDAAPNPCLLTKGLRPAVTPVPFVFEVMSPAKSHVYAMGKQPVPQF